VASIRLNTSQELDVRWSDDVLPSTLLTSKVLSRARLSTKVSVLNMHERLPTDMNCLERFQWSPSFFSIGCFFPKSDRGQEKFRSHDSYCAHKHEVALSDRLQDGCHLGTQRQ
jgi:hypothetical protein